MSKFELLSIDKKSGEHRFLLKNATPAYANAIRRAILEYVPTMAVDTVEFRKNSGALYDEMLALRLGLLPLTTDLKSYKLGTGADGEDGPQFSCQLTLKAKGPGYILAKDIESQDPSVKPVFPNTPIGYLLKNQELELIATAKLGVGREHAKFVPGLIWYTYDRTVKVDNNHPDFDKFKGKYPKTAFKGGKLDAQAIRDNNLFDACEKVHEGLVSIEHDEKNFVFHVEPWGQLSAKDILTTAIDTLKTRLTEVSASL
jgi:DNA-directed RNA polymerase subunit D